MARPLYPVNACERKDQANNRQPGVANTPRRAGKARKEARFLDDNELQNISD
jgi:hypothetical protein